MAKAKQREAGMMAITGGQGIGKTYQNMHIIADYVKDKFYNGVKGRKCLIFDTNGEYTKEQFAKNDVTGIEPKKIAISDVEKWSHTDVAECRRLDAKNLGLKEKRVCVEYLLKVFRNGMLVLEDINTYILSVTFMEEIVGGIVNLRHRAVDVMISYQSARPVEPRIWQNSRWVRMHHQSDNVMDIKGKLPDVELFKIAQLIVSNRYYNGDKRFYVIIHVFDKKVQGSFTMNEFVLACEQFLNGNKKYAKEEMELNRCSLDEAIDHKIEKYKNQYLLKK
jgi:hypothetical protein